MLTLVINTATSTTQIALLKGEELFAEDSWQSKNNEAEFLLPRISELTPELHQIKKVICISGPGSFTGLRIGITVANTISYLNAAELFSINTFEYLWQQAPSPESALLVFAGSRGVYLYHPSQEVEIVKLEDLAAKLEKYPNCFGDISPEQKSYASNFIETTHKLSDLDHNKLTPCKIIQPNYVKEPSITPPKCCT
ncbi:tRNA (adenosine(37)-N6)-threonylcarbamoyltransferase complex dimerization subunit type 1 TsaB [Candidatus Gracilibacteria bacterium]|nr:tRNA (adenosine(37)-N6)-threonylcarbamoyltransferase complex dimerization subunit type 1 TsaB [Candidatus Gracilibacteria bacterium]